MSKKATIIAVVNQKGGTGKTTTTENLGVGLALEGKKVLLVDTDPQASLTVSLGNPCPDDLSPTLSDLMGKIMMENPITPDEGILHHPEGVDLVPSNIELSGMEVALVNAMSRETILRQYLDTVKQNYDYILLDCMPSLGMYDALLKQDEKEAHHVATALEIYVKGSLKLFNNRTNVDIQNRLVCFDIKELGNQLKKIGMLIVQDQVWGRVTANRSAGKSTRYYIDEFHLLLKEEQTATYSVEIWKRFRKWGGLPTGITQNVKDLLRSPEIANILENSDFIYMLNQASDDRSILAQRLNISPHQLSYVTNSGEGEGLLFYGNVILPFIDRFPTDLELYRIMTTKLNEVAQEKEA